jgi:hypothetical protein
MRLGMQWEQLCQAVLRSDLGAVELTPGVTLEVTLADSTTHKSPGTSRSRGFVFCGP